MKLKQTPFLLITVMTASVLVVTFITIWLLYDTALEQQSTRLVEVAQSQARVIEAMFEHAQKKDANSPAKAASTALEQITNAHQKFIGFGETGEFTLGKITDNNIVFLISHRHFDINKPKPVPISSTLAEPMRRALQNKSGTVIAHDYRGETVLAAHEPVSNVDWGIVAKIDMSEIQAPFIRAGIYSGIAAVFMIFLGSGLFLMITQPLIQKIKDSEFNYRKLFNSSEEKYQALFRASNDAMVIFADDEIIDCNDAALKMFHCDSSEDILGKHPGEISPQYQPNGMASSVLANEKIAATFKTGVNFFEWTHRRKNTANFPAEVLLTAISLDDRSVLQATIRDITLRKKAEEEIMRQKTELEASNKELESYSYSIAHDLRAPLRAITSFSQLLKDDIGDKISEEDSQYLSRIIAAGKNMANMIHDILQLSRITRSELCYHDINLSNLANQILEQLVDEFPEKNVQCKIQENMKIKGDPALISVALQNLLDNAFKYTREASPAIIEMGSEQGANELIFYVKDNGVGLDMTYANKLFKPFHRLHNQEFEGTGIGLATVHRVIQRHGGKVWVESEKNQGATFYFTLGPQNNIGY